MALVLQYLRALRVSSDTFPKEKKINTRYPGCFHKNFETFFCLCTYHLLGAGHVSNGHITVKAPHPIRTAKLSTVELDQYFGRGLQGNLQCCWAYFFFCRICDLKSPQMSHMRHILFTFHFFFAKSKLTNGSLRSGPPLCCPFHSQGRRCVMDHYTHEAEERNKIKF